MILLDTTATNCFALTYHKMPTLLSDKNRSHPSPTRKLLTFIFHPSCRAMKKKKKEEKQSRTIITHIRKKNMLHLQISFSETNFQQLRRNGEDGLYWNRNWQEQIKTIIFGLIKVQFHWIGKYLCKIEIVENSIFVFQVLPPPGL